jgi:hypothetical protein
MVKTTDMQMVGMIGAGMSRIGVILMLSFLMSAPGDVRNSDPCGNCTCHRPNWSKCSAYCYQRHSPNGSPTCMSIEESKACHKLCIKK